MPFATINNHKLHYTDTAPSTPSSSTQTILFVHGLGSTQNFYQPILPALSSHRCITYDNYGAGRSPYSGDEVSVASIAQDAIGLLDFLGIDRAVIVGYSMGGMIPTYIAATAPGRIVAGICVGPVHPGDAVAEVFRKRVPVVQEGGMETMANVIPNAATGPGTSALQKAFIREMLLGQSPEGYVANCRAIELATPPDYSKVTARMLIIAGEVDKSAPLEGCETIFAGLATPAGQKELRVLEGCGHWHCVERTTEVGQMVKEFVEGL